MGFGWWQLVKKSQIVLYQAAIGRAPIGGFTPFAVIDIERHIAAGVKLLTPVVATAAIYKNLEVFHSDLGGKPVNLCSLKVIDVLELPKCRTLPLK